MVLYHRSTRILSLQEMYRSHISSPSVASLLQSQKYVRPFRILDGRAQARPCAHKNSLRSFLCALWDDIRTELISTNHCF